MNQIPIRVFVVLLENAQLIICALSLWHPWKHSAHKYLLTMHHSNSISQVVFICIYIFYPRGIYTREFFLERSGNNGVVSVCLPFSTTVWPSSSVSTCPLWRRSVLSAGDLVGVYIRISINHRTNSPGWGIYKTYLWLQMNSCFPRLYFEIYSHYQ